MSIHWNMNVRERVLQPEWMDEPGLDVALHHSALRGLERVNAISLIHRTFWPSIQRIAQQDHLKRVRVLDVACGGGDVTVRLQQAAQRAGLQYHVDGCDLSPTAVAFASERATRLNLPCHFFQFDVLNDSWPTTYDVIVNSLFLHHLTTNDVVKVLTKMSQASRHLVLVNDLVRCREGYFLARFAAPFLSRSPIVHSDGPISVAASFTAPELLELAQSAGMSGAAVSRVWPARMLLKWNKS